MTSEIISPNEMMVIAGWLLNSCGQRDQDRGALAETMQKLITQGEGMKASGAPARNLELMAAVQVAVRRLIEAKDEITEHMISLALHDMARRP